MLELAFLHVARNRQRVALAVLSAAFATLVFIFALLLSQGVPGAAVGAHERLLGGEILVLRGRPAIPEAGVPTGGGWALRPPSLDLPEPYDLLAPERFLYPHPAKAPVADASQEAAEWRALGQRLLEVPGVRAVQPYLTLPAYIEFTTGFGPDAMPPSADPATWQLRVAPRRLRVDLRARDPELDRELGLAPEVVAGRGLTAADEGRPAALVEAPAGGGAYQRLWVLWDDDRPMYVPSMPPGPGGGTLEVALPRWRDGAPDYEDAVEVELDVVGQYWLDDGWWLWGANHLAARGLEPANYHAPDRPPPNEPKGLTTPQIFVPIETWRQLAAEAGYPGDPLAWVVAVEDTSELNVVLARLREAYPERTILAVMDLAAAHPLALAPTFETPPADVAALAAQGAEPDRPLAPAPTWVRRWMSGLAAAMALSVFFANVFALYHARQRELAVLRVVGAGRPQVAGLVVCEVLLVALLGSALAAAASLPLALYQAVSGGGGLARALALTGAEIGIAAGVAAAFSALLGTGLALWTLRRAPWGVLRVE